MSEGKFPKRKSFVLAAKSVAPKGHSIKRILFHNGFRHLNSSTGNQKTMEKQL